MPGTVRLHRVFTCAPGKIYRAFTEPDAYAAWLPPRGFTATVHQMEARLGGGFHMSFRNFTTGQSHSFGGSYLELESGRRIRHNVTAGDTGRRRPRRSQYQWNHHDRGRDTG